jgi:hypothetical protein
MAAMAIYIGQHPCSGCQWQQHATAAPWLVLRLPSVIDEIVAIVVTASLSATRR